MAKIPGKGGTCNFKSIKRRKNYILIREKQEIMTRWIDKSIKIAKNRNIIL